MFWEPLGGQLNDGDRAGRVLRHGAHRTGHPIGGQGAGADAVSQVTQAGERQLGGRVGISQPGVMVRFRQAFRMGTGEAERVPQGYQTLLCTVMQVALQVGPSLTRASAPASRPSVSRRSRAAAAASVTAAGSIRGELP